VTHLSNLRRSSMADKLSWIVIIGGLPVLALLIVGSYWSV
jgi:hypothetical protein